MGKGGFVKGLLEELGLKSRIEVSQARSFVKGVLGEKGQNAEREELLDLLQVYLKLIKLDARELDNIPRSTMIGLGHALFMAKKQGDLSFLSLASPAYKQDATGRHIDIGSGESKKEYHLPPLIRRRLEELGLLFSYTVLLADIDSELVDKTAEEVEMLFARNLQGLRTASGMSAKRLSRFIDMDQFEILKAKARCSERLAKQVRQLQNRPTVLAAHKITPEAIADRAVVYAALGKLFEEDTPETVLLDIQGRIYPYEQPFYNALRRFPLPLLRLAET